ncbi:MAG TPA: zf-HC2 domain-containing protein [Micromonosporaceae bacterium]
MDDHVRVECNACREILSARLDGEDLPGEAAQADVHLTGCPECARWWRQAVAVTRMVRLAAAEPSPALGDRLDPELLAASAPGPGQHRAAALLRWSLGLLGLAQFLLGMIQVNALGSGEHDHAGSVGPAHLWHESAAWNIAIGAGFGWIALRRTRPVALIPLMSAFVAMLLLLSTNDIAHGEVDRARLLSHGFVLAGYLVLLALSRPRFDFGDPPPRRRTWPRLAVLGEDGAA